MARIALKVSKLLHSQGIGATVIDPRWVVPVPESVVSLAADYRLVVSIEDGVRVGGIGTRIRQDLREAGVDTAVTEIGLPDEFLAHGDRSDILASVRLTATDIAHDVTGMVLGVKQPHAKPERQYAVHTD